MPAFKVTGFERASAKSVTWYLQARSRPAAEAHASQAGLVDAEIEPIDPTLIPPEVTLIHADDKPAAKPFEPSLFWIIVFAVIVGNLATAAIMKLIGSLH